MNALNSECYRYIDNIIITQLKYHQAKSQSIIRIDLDDLYEYFIDHGYFLSNYKYYEFREDLCEQLDIADYTYLLEIRKYDTTYLTIEMDY